MLEPVNTPSSPGRLSKGFRIPSISVNVDGSPGTGQVDSSLLSPRRSSSVASVAANSPRHASGSQVAIGSGLNSPRTPAYDPMAAMPSFKRGSIPGSSEPSLAALPASPSMRSRELSSSNSFSARHSIDFRRSLPGAVQHLTGSPSTHGHHSGGGALSSPADTIKAMHNHLHVVRSSDFGAHRRSSVASEGRPRGGASDTGQADDDDDDGPDGDEGNERELDAALRDLVLLRHHSFHPSRSGDSPTGSRNARHSMRLQDEDEFMQRLTANRHSWKSRASSGAQGPGQAGGEGGGGAGHGLQDKTHAALEQLRGELKSLSTRSMSKSLSMNAGVGPGSGVGSGAAQGAGGGGGSGGYGGGGGGGAGAFGRVGELSGPGSGSGPHCHAQQSPSRLSISNSNAAALEHFPAGAASSGGSGHHPASPHSGPQPPLSPSPSPSLSPHPGPALQHYRQSPVRAAAAQQQQR